jgi:A/G-specific adenine glycosylase
MRAASLVFRLSETRRAASPLPGKELSAFRRALLAWYDKHRRDLPWRKTRDPYRIWLSEIMLQQTRVAAVLEHYRLFLERFPTIHALSKASESAVLSAWSGLGYYRRARMLHQCAGEIVAQYRGRFPQSSDALRALPGIGRYTAAAVASIAFDEPVAVVDGNVERVLERLTLDDLPPERIWSRAQLLLSRVRPGDFNQAMMELGATVCVPRQPKCAECPVRRWCRAQGDLPRKAPSLESRASSPGGTPTRISSRQVKKEIWCVLGECDGRICLVRRPKKLSLMPGMWELPQWSQVPRRIPDSARWRTFRHSITVTDYTVHVIRSTATAAKGKWLPIAKLPEVPITGLTRKILKAGGVI